MLFKKNKKNKPKTSIRLSFIIINFKFSYQSSYQLTL